MKNKIKFLTEWTLVECEKCSIICCYRKGIERIDRNRWTRGATMTGTSEKYPGRIAAWCEKHQIF